MLRKQTLRMNVELKPSICATQRAVQEDRKLRDFSSSLQADIGTLAAIDSCSNLPRFDGPGNRAVKAEREGVQCSKMIEGRVPWE